MKRIRFQKNSLGKTGRIKRILTIFCICTFVITCFMSVFADSESVSGSGESETDNHAVNLLIKLKILEIGDSSMTTIAVTREDFAVYTANLLEIDTNQISTKRYFSDTDMESYGTYAIERLVEMGIISRANDNKFRPNDKITLNEAIKMMCSATGYGEYAERRGGFPDGYIRCARENSFLITPKNSNELSMTEAAEIIFNAAQVAIFEPTVFSTADRIKFSAKSENTLLSVYHKIYFGTGLVTGIYGLTTDGVTAEDEKIRISDDNDKTDEYKIAPETANDDFLGDYVKYFYYKESSDSEGEVIYLYNENDDKNIKFSSKDFISYNASEMKYYDADAEKEKIVSLKNAVIVYNGVPVKTDINKTFDNIKKGHISIKKSGTNRKRDIVIISDYTNVITSGIDSVNLTIYNKLNSKDYFSLNEYETVRIFDSAMNRITFSDIKSGSAVSAAASRDDKELITLIVSNTVMNGTLESVRYENDNLVVSIGGKSFVVDKNYEDEFKAAASVGGSYYYTFDFTDEIVYVSEVSTDVMSFGYILRTVLDADGFSDGIKIKMINGDAKIEYAELAERVRIDGVAYKDDVKKMFWAMFASNNGTEREMPIRYQKDESGKIKEIDTPYMNAPYESDKNSLTSVYDEDFSKRYGRSGRLGLKAYLNNNTKVFEIPDTPIFGEIRDSDVRIAKGPDITFQEFSNANVYTTNILNEYTDMVVRKYDYSQINLNDTGRTTFVVSDIIDGLDDDGAECRILCGYLAGVYKEYKMDSEIELSGIGEGDIVKLHFDVNGNPIPSYTASEPDIQMLYDYSKLNGTRPSSEDGWLGIDSSADGNGRCYFASSADVNTDYYYAKLQLSFGYAHRVTGDMVQVGYRSGENFDEIFRTSNIKVTVVDKSKRSGNKVYQGSVKDIEDYASVGEQCSTVILHTRYCDAMSLIVYK